MKEFDELENEIRKLSELRKQIVDLTETVDEINAMVKALTYPTKVAVPHKQITKTI